MTSDLRSLLSRSLRSALTFATALGALSLLTACGGGEGEIETAVGLTAAELEDMTIFDLPPEVLEYFETKVDLPPAIFEAFERGEISQEEIDQRTAAGEFEKFFVFASPEDLPTDLEWLDGMDLPEPGSPEAVKGGIHYRRLQDFPRTFRLFGPDANGSFRPFILDDIVMQYARRSDIDTEVGPQGHHYYPGVAEAWAIDRENKTVYVRLNPRARWSDGVPIRVKDVFYMFYLYQNPHIQAPWYNNWYERQYSQVTRYDELTFSIRMPEAKPDMNARVLELDPRPAHFYGVLDENFVDDFQWRFQPTTGAYVFREGDMAKGRYIRLTRNDDWWAKDNKYWRYRYNFDTIHFTVIRDTPKAFEAFKKGELDLFTLNLAEYYYERLPNDDALVEDGYVHKYTFYNDVPRPTYGLWINTDKPLLENKDVRQGIQYAANFDRVIEEYFRGDYVRMRTSSDGYGDFTHPDLQMSRPFDPEQALAAFRRAGFTERGPDGILVNEQGQKLSFTLTTGYESLKDVLSILQEEAVRAGLELRVEVLDGTAGWKKAQEKKHDIMFSAFGVSPEMYPRYWETWHSVNAYKDDGTIKTQTNNLTSFENERMDQLIERYRASESAEEMMELAFQMEEILAEEAVFVPGFVMPFYRFASWRWIRWPEGINVKLSEDPTQRWLMWMEPGAREETMQAMRTGETFEKVIEKNDTHNTYAD
ncbi:MAG: extracellular solute-binding protein [Opitutales bacterium]